MRKIITIMFAAAAFFAAQSTADAQVLKNLLNKVKGSSTTTTTTTVSEATTNGKAAGAALKALYTQYKADKKLDMSNLNNIANVATLSANIQGLKGQSNKGAFYKDFAAGLISGSNNLVNESNSTKVMNTLTSLVENVDISGAEQKATEVATTATEKASSAASSVSDIASSVTSILNLFK